MYDYAICFEQDDSASGVAVFCRDLPELNSFGDDREHAIREALDAIETTLSLYVDARKPIPEATPPEEGEHVVHLPSVTVAKIALWNEMMKRGMRKSDLCKLLGIAQTQGDRLVDFLHNTKMDAVEAALLALGTRLRQSVEVRFDWVKLRHERADDVILVEVWCEMVSSGHDETGNEQGWVSLPSQLSTTWNQIKAMEAHQFATGRQLSISVDDDRPGESRFESLGRIHLPVTFYAARVSA
ncbi:TPA: type II toxin-antitoxin system HicB family antitoxin [Pseudomonas aeruginosa]|uniref:type II toxin-antitoxin system HicB family antitoxin n=1 Tax=Pseudomonas aeruginosa TaxID=287 RepID=UPI001F2D67BF|nr:type II toxin-antitoxin system HicB family antitoxin [Pseudomonas aeruginosa]